VPHVFVETNWLFDYAAPAHHHVPAAADLLERARQGEFTLHIPNCCLAEVRKVIAAKCQPRNEAKAIRQFLTQAESFNQITEQESRAARILLDQFERTVRRDLDGLNDTLVRLGGLDCVQIFAFDDAMLARSTELAMAGLNLDPFDQAILAGVLVKAERLWQSGERELSFCERDSDLQPWDKEGRTKPLLRNAYDEAHLWVYGDFTLTRPQRRQGFE
jgi:predicted nucleic acid-binding protein